MKQRHKRERSRLSSAQAIMVRACVVVAAIGWSAPAGAFMGYPPVVDKWLGKDGLVETFEKPMGCQLCHVSDQGGTVQLRPFGNLLVASYGVTKTAEQDTVLMGALIGLQAENPTLFTDMQNGLDPNVDPALTAQVLPQPEYGCSTARPRPAGAENLILLALVPLARAFRRPRRRRKRDSG